MPRHVTSADGSRIAFDVSGAGRSLVLVHGAAGSRRSVGRLAHHLARDLRVIAYDRRGRGDSSEVRGHGLQREAEDLLAIAAAQPDEPAVVGISFGAVVMLEAFRAGLACRSAVLFEPPVLTAPDPERLALAETLAGLLAEGRLDEAVALHAGAVHGKSEAEIAAMREGDEWRIRRRVVPHAVREMYLLQSGQGPSLADLPEPGFPVHLLHGSDTSPMLKDSARALSTLPFVQEQVVPGLGHSAPRDAPRALAAAIRAALQARGDRH